MKSFKMMAALLAAAFAATILWAAPRPAQEFDQEAQEYKDYWLASVQKHKDEKLGRLLVLDDLRYFCEQHSQCLLSRVDFAAEAIKIGEAQKGLEALKEAKKILATVPETEEGKFSKAKYYRLMTDVNLYVSPGGAKGEFAAGNAASSCAKNNELLGAQAYYTLANFLTNKKWLKAIGTFDQAMSHDKTLALLQASDVKAYALCCQKQNGGFLMSSFLDKFFSAKDASYFLDLGAIAASGYESGWNKTRAVLSAMLDKEYTWAYSDAGADDLIAVLKKNYGSGSGATAPIAFIQKYFDQSQSLGEEDLKALPEKDRDFLTVRYMYKMRNSNDIGALIEEFEKFFGSMKSFYLRLLKKTQANGDKKSAEEINKILAEKFPK